MPSSHQRYKYVCIQHVCLNNVQVERESKLPFPGVLRPDDSSESHYLMGVALRKVTIFGIHAYAVGVYFAESALRNIKDCNSLLQKAPPYLIRIVPARDTSLSHIKSALGRSLEKRLSEVLEAEQPKCRHELQQFLGAFPNAKIKMGESLLMWGSANGDVFVARPDHEAVKISSNFISRALLSIYLDTSTTIPQVYFVRRLMTFFYSFQ